MTYKKLSRLSNEDLVERFQRVGSTKERVAILGILYRNNSGLIRSIAEKYTAYESLEDLMQESFFGLQTAAELYDISKETAFSTYAAVWIRQAMRRYIDNCGACVRIPAYKRGQIYQYKQILNRYLVEFGREPTGPELSKLLNISLETAKQIKEDKSRLRIVSLDTPIEYENGDTMTIGERIPSKEDTEADIIEIVYNERISLILWDQVEQLEEPERDIIKTRYTDNLTVKEAAERMGCTEQEAKSAEAKAMRKLRRNEKIRSIREDFISALAYHHRGVGAFKRTNTSITEHAAIKDYISGCREEI